MTIPEDLKNDWIKRIDEHRGTVSEDSLLVPYNVDDVYSALLRLHERIRHGIHYDDDPDSKSVLFGAKKSVWTGGLTFKAYSTVDATSDGGTLVFMYVKVYNPEQILQELFNLLTDILENDYAKSTSSDALENSFPNKSVDVYGSEEYRGKKNRFTKKQSKFSGVYYVILGALMMFAGLSGGFVLRFTNSSEALVLFSLLPLGYGIYKLYKGFNS